MLKLNIKKSYWLGLISLLLVLGVFFKLALAITAFDPANQPVGYVAQDDLTNYDLSSGKEVLFRGEYEKEYWGGNLIAYALNSFGDIASATQPWSGGAAYQLELQGSDRRIVTLKSDGTKIPFTWASLSAAQQGNLGSSAILDFLRGVRTGEIQQGGSFRQRASPMGDVVHSRPYYVSDSGSTTPKPTVFVGANDGMLHAIDALTGYERWAYVPSMLIPKMQKLSSISYAHDYYVDGSVNVATILAGSKRVLVGALGAGGKGLYALDITGSARLAPADEASAATNILWEITPTTVNNVAATAYANLGFTYASPTLAKVGGTDVVIIGNGYNNGGDYQAYLYVINANTGALISAIKAGTSGTAASPNGLSTPVAIDSDNDGNVDTVYAGDLNGTMWKFNLTGVSASPLLTTSPAQPITMTPGVARHPNGGYMVNFATGAMLTTADTTDASVFAAYGIWDGAPTANTALLTQTLTERCYTSGTSVAATPCANRVRTVTSSQPVWTAGATNHKGWRVALPASEKVVGDGSFIENGRFYFTAHNPTVSTTVQSSTVKGENWLMELDYLTGGTKNSPFLDLSGNVVLDNDDRVKDSASPPAPVLTTDGVPVGKFISIGVLSQPVLVQLSSLNNTLFNQNPDVSIVPLVLDIGEGVAGGHFDEDIYYGSTTGGAQASATITVGTSGQSSGYPATLGAITVDGVTIVPEMTVVDIPNGTVSGTNAGTIKNKVTGGFTATVVGSVVTIKAPVGAQYNSKTISIAAGTSSPLKPAVAGVRPTGLLKFAGGTSSSSTTAAINATLSGSTSVRLGTATFANAVTIGRGRTPIQAASAVVAAIGTRGTLKAYLGGNSVTSTCASETSATVCLVDNSTYTNGTAVQIGTQANFSTLTVSTVATAGAVTPVAASGWTNFAPALTASTFSNTGADPVSVGEVCVVCRSKAHFHEYDDKYNVTGVNMLNPSNTTLDLKLAIPSQSLPFKVIAQNQYLSPAAKLHIGDPSYLSSVDFGYIKLKDYVTSATLDLAALQTYKRDPNTVWPGTAATDADKLAKPKFIGSLTMNLPVNALTARDWWGNGDVRAGLHPTKTGCVKSSANSQDGNMYQPVIPPANGTDGPGTAGWSNSTSTRPDTATGVRHNGALTIQIIRDTTPNSALELSVPGRPEYGWRVKSVLYATHVLAEYTTFWHHPNGLCYSDTGWTKAPVRSLVPTTAGPTPPGTTDPKIGDLSAGGSALGVTIAAVTRITVDGVTTTVIKYSDGTQATIVRTANKDGSVTIVTTDALGKVTTQTIANTDGSLMTGGDERGLQARTGRISWRELVKP